MIRKIDDLNYYELLEISPQATSQEIHKAYERIRRVYEPNSIALYSLFTPEETSVIHQRIEEAYRTLVYDDNRKKYDAMLRDRHELPEPPPSPAPKYHAAAVPPALSRQSEDRQLSRSDVQPSPPAAAPARPQEKEVSPVPPVIAEFSGPAIKVLREHRGLTLRDVADTTKISSRYLEFIETENYTKLPARAYIRGFIMLYAKALGHDPERMAGDYLKRYDATARKDR